MDTVQPLRISKNNTPASSPTKMAASATSRPLSEIGSTERRRNSPSYNQATKKMIVTSEASPYTENSSPPSFAKPSPHDFWTGRDATSPSRFDNENSPAQDASPLLSSPKRRPSVEKLMQASRVRNSNIFALESKDAYDPSNMPIVERPIANRPFTQSVANNSFARFESLQKENYSPHRPGHKRGESQTQLPILTPSKGAAGIPLPPSPDKENRGSPSPAKSSLSRTSQFGLSPQTSFSRDKGEPDGGRTPRGHHRQTKSVTFHHDPPVVNEYEEQTPEPSLSIASDREGSWDSEEFDEHDISFDRGSSVGPDHRDDSFDADLENADKTPVVLPEDWSRMSPDEARTDLVDAEDDVFDDGDATQRGSLIVSSAGAGRVASDGEARPLPPLPAFMQRERRESDSLSGGSEHAVNGVRAPASCSKDEILNVVGKSSLAAQKDPATLEHSNPITATDTVVEEALVVTNLDTGETREVQVNQTEIEDDSIIADLADFAKAPPRISRESILRKVRNSKYEFEDFGDEDDADQSELNHNGTDVTRPSIAELARMDPDQPIPSRENSREISSVYPGAHHTATEPVIKEEAADEDAFDLHSIPTTQNDMRSALSPSHATDFERQNSVLRHKAGSLGDEEQEMDMSSRYSSMEAPDAESSVIHIRQQTLEHDDGKETLQDAMQLLTVKDYGSKDEPRKQGSGDFVGLPAYFSTDDFDFGMKDFISPSLSTDFTQQAPVVLQDTMPRLQPPIEFERPSIPQASLSTPAESRISPPSSPDSVIRHDDGLVSPIEESKEFFTEQQPRDLPAVPDRVASIKTPGGKLKARPSSTPADLQIMAEQRRMMSAEHPVPAIPAMYQTPQDNEAIADDDASSSVYSSEETVDHPITKEEKTPKADRRKSRKSGGRMDLSFLDTSTFSLYGQDEDLSLGLDQDFNRISEAQKNGYFMRESTKVVVATARNFSGDSDSTARSDTTAKTDETVASKTTASETPRPAKPKKDSSSPRKASEEQFFKTEPWNGKIRRKSIRQASALKSSHSNDVAPPLPGHESALGVVNEEHATNAGNLEEEISDGVERGRLFVKVVGVKDLDLPLPRNDRIYFQLTLDNGLHCVTTTSLELGTNAPIGQEFELVVLNDLEFQLTLTTKLPPRPERTPPSSSGSPTKSPVKSQKGSSFARFLSSPKKRAEKERQEREAAEAEERRLHDAAQRKRMSEVITAWDLLHDLVNATDGSFARAYVNLKAHEKQCFGRQLTVDVPCYNEWALENDAHVVNSVRSKRGTRSGPIRRPPYVVGQLQLQLLYVPKPKEATDADMPKSMSAALREMKKASEMGDAVHEGHLSQQGGDCTHWRRRFFRLQGTKLTAYHEHTHQKRAVINLSKASRLVDDKSMLVAGPSPTKSKGRRKSAFAEEDEAYQYVEEGFRMRFANGETIDFYADNRDQKEQWMVVLSQVIGKPDSSTKPATWTDLVLARERMTGGRPGSAGVGTASPVKQSVPEVKDFGRPIASRDGATSRDGMGSRGSHNTTTSSASTIQPPVTKSAPVSPRKSAPNFSAPTASATAKATTRPSTPPMSPRRAGRTRDAVKSMIF